MSTRDFHRVNVAQKTSYTYHTANGDITIRPSEETGVTIEFIHMLHREDNRVVDQNIKQARRPMTEAERRDIEAWRNDEEHPERMKGDFPDKYQRWNLPIDGLRNEDDDESADGPLDRDPVLREAFTAQMPETPSEVERLRAFILLSAVPCTASRSRTSPATPRPTLLVTSTRSLMFPRFGRTGRRLSISSRRWTT